MVTLSEAWAICRALDADDAALRAAQVERASTLAAPTRPARGHGDGDYELCRFPHVDGLRCRRKDNHAPPHRWWDSGRPARIVEW